MKHEVQPSITLRLATPGDCADVAVLIKRAGLPVDDIDHGLEGFLVAVDGDQIVGTVGVERYGEVALLRSLAVAEPYRNRQIGDQLYQEALRCARRQGVHHLYLLTTTAEGYFAKRGFVTVPRNEAPDPIKHHEQFSRLCPESAIFMEKKI
ncbi:MAG: arsenic resistance N-acetyltransferase ArsN2 [bacterium]